MNVQFIWTACMRCLMYRLSLLVDLNQVVVSFELLPSGDTAFSCP